MPDDERAKLLERRAKLDARLKQLALQDQKQKRKDDTRLKVIAGALILEDALIKPETAARLSFLVSRYVTRPQERTLFDNFFSDRSNDSKPSASDSFAAAALPSPVTPDSSPDPALPAADNPAASAAAIPTPDPP